MRYTIGEYPGENITRTFIVEDHALFRQMLGRLVGRMDRMSLCGEAETAATALAKIPDCKPELVLVDISLPDMDGIALIRSLHQQYPALFLLVVSGHEEKVYALSALKAGARGYVMKGKVDKIKQAILRVCRGEIYVSEAIWAKLMEIE